MRLYLAYSDTSIVFFLAGREEEERTTLVQSSDLLSDMCFDSLSDIYFITFYLAF